MASVDHLSAAEIEREIEDERSALTRTLDEIHDRLSFEALTGEFVDRVRDNGSDIGRSVVRTVKENPIPLALTAMGLAWLAASQRGGAPRSDADERAPFRHGTGRVAGRGADLRDSETAADPALRQYASGRALPGGEPRWDETVADSGQDAHEPADDAAGRLSRASRSVRRGAESVYASAADLRQRIANGTEEMSGHARKRVIAARTRAYEAQLRAEKYTARGREKASDLYEGQPLVAGALALAFGAAIGGLLPRTRRENQAFGAHRDSVFDEAERIYREERGNLESVARETAREMKDVAQNLASDVRDNVEKHAQNAGDIARAKLDEATGTDEAGTSKLRQV